MKVTLNYYQKFKYMPSCKLYQYYTTILIQIINRLIIFIYIMQQISNHQIITQKNLEETTAVIILEPQKQQTPTKKEPQDVQQDQQSITLVSSSKHNNERRYGNYVSLVDNKYITLNLGPDYLCFVPTFIVFTFFAYIVIVYINNNVKNIYVVVITYIVCIGQCLSYLLVSLSDPGIAHPLTQSQKSKLNKTSFCRKCRFDIPQSTFHCVYCDVCIIGYDHHCPWTSKCIGKNNLIRFYIFLFWTPVFIVYSAFIFGFTIDAVEKNNSHLRNNDAGK